jgi:small-conductance mechanosensitive channel
LRIRVIWESKVFLQVSSDPSIVTSVFDRIVKILNYRFIDQKEYSVSVLSILFFVIIFLIAVLVSRYARRLIERRLLRKLDVDIGLQYTLLRITHYLIIVFGFLYGIKVGFGVDLTSLAVILGFLSVGIGFGLQYLASDLASGLILLFERPMRIGDRLKVGEIEGRVHAINIRTTVIVTNDDIAVILPNSELVRSKFINYSYGSPVVRISVPVGVAYASDVEKVKAALIQAAGLVKQVLSTKAPEVRLKGFGGSSLDFELLVLIDQPHDHAKIRSFVNFQIFKVLTEQGIEIPFPQQDLHLRSGTITIDDQALRVESGDRDDTG